MYMINHFPRIRKTGAMRLTALLVCLLSLLPATAQSDKGKLINYKCKGEKLQKALVVVERQSGYYRIQYVTEDVAPYMVTANIKNATAEEAVGQLLQNTALRYETNGRFIHIIADKKQAASGRTRTIKGYVRDDEGEPLIGVPVCIGETRVCTVTDADGFYTFPIPVEQTTLKFSYVGMETAYATIPAGTSDVTKDITLKSSLQLNDVVVVGYGSMARKDLTGSVVTVNPEELSMSPAVTIDDALTGKAAGVQVTKADGSPGGAVRIRVRGGASLTGGVDPLYVIDGIPVEVQNNYISSIDTNNPLEWSTGGNDDIGAISGAFMRGLNSMSGLNINDIETITIMKDASATAIYGSKAANGVVIITTKRGQRDQKPVFNVSYSVGVSSPVKEKLLNGQQYLSALESAITTSNHNLEANRSEIGESSYSRNITSNNNLLNRVKQYVQENGNANTDWLDLILRQGISHNVDFSVSGGSASSRYYSSLSYTNQDGTLIGTDFNRITGNVSMDNDITSRFRTFIKMNVSYSKNDLNSGVYTQALAAPPILPAYTEDGSLANYSAIGGVNYTYIGYQNPMAMSRSTNRAKTYGFKGSISGEYDILESLKFRTTASINYSNYNQLNYIPSYVLTMGSFGAEENGGGQGSQAQSTKTSIFWENTLTYNKAFNDIHSINAVVGHAWEKNKSDYFSASGKGYPDDDYLNNLSSAAIAASVSGSNPIDQSSLLSFYGRVNYHLMDRYLITFSGRSDTSSKFAKRHRTGFFPSGALAWRISEEPFLSNVKWIDEIKLRCSIGLTGTQNIGNWMFLTLYSPDSYNDKNALYPSQLGNDDIKWESTLQKDIGLDFSFYKGRLTGSLGYYYKLTDDALLSINAAPSSGFKTLIRNIARIRNQGWEVELNGDFIRTKTLKWSGSLNISSNKSLVKKIRNEQFSNYSNRRTMELGTSIIREGESLGLLCGIIADGVITNAEELAAYKEDYYYWIYFTPDLGVGSVKLALDDTGFYYKDVIGNCTPDFYGGYTNMLNYKNWGLQASFTFSYGNDLIYQKDVNDMSFNSLSNHGVRVLEASSYNNFTGRPLSSYSSTENLTNLNVYDASYLKLQTLTLSYNFNQSFLKRFGLNSMQAYVTASNVFTLTSYPGPDPSVSDDKYSICGGGRDISSYPTVKSYTFGLRIGF